SSPSRGGNPEGAAPCAGNPSTRGGAPTAARTRWSADACSRAGACARGSRRAAFRSRGTTEVVETAAHALGLDREKEPSRARTDRLSDEGEVDGSERVPRGLALRVQKADLLRGLVELVLHFARIVDRPDERPDRG